MIYPYPMGKTVPILVLLAVVAAAGHALPGPGLADASSGGALAAGTDGPCEDPVRAERLLCPDLRIARPSEIVLTGDCCHGMGDAWRFAWPRAPGGYSSSPRRCDVARNDQNPDHAVHNGGDNLGFVDGPAKWMSATSFYGQRNTMYYNPHL